MLYSIFRFSASSASSFSFELREDLSDSYSLSFELREDLSDSSSLSFELREDLSDSSSLSFELCEDLSNSSAASSTRRVAKEICKGFLSSGRDVIKVSNIELLPEP